MFYFTDETCNMSYMGKIYEKKFQILSFFYNLVIISEKDYNRRIYFIYNNLNNSILIRLIYI